jgi:hypothetical protein
MITFFFVVPSTAAMDATQVSIPPGYPSGTTQSNPTNATAYRLQRREGWNLEAWSWKRVSPRICIGSLVEQGILWSKK